MTDAEMSAWCRAEAANWTSAASHYADDSGMRRVQEERAAVLLRIANRLDAAPIDTTSDNWPLIRMRDNEQPSSSAPQHPIEEG